MACGPFGTLRITDGTDSVDLFAAGSVFHITGWRPSIAEPKAGGVWRDSSLSHGRQLALRMRGNTIETMTLEVAGFNADHLIRELQELRRLLEKAVTYWTTDWQDEPVWIEAQGLGETNPRYSLVHDYRTPADGFPYGQPFWSELGTAGMSDFDLILEREDCWRADEPGTGTCVKLSAVESYDGRDYGTLDDIGGVTLYRFPTCDEGTVFLTNKRNEANITDIYHYAVGPGWVGNLEPWPGAAFNLLPGVGNNDFVIFGIDTGLADSGPFNSLIFDLGGAIGGVNLTGTTWQYWTGAWTAFAAAVPATGIQDNTDTGGFAFDTLGINGVYFEQPNNWIIGNPNAMFPATGAPNINGYWIRLLVSATGAYNVPQQQERNIYTVTWPYTEIYSTTGLAPTPPERVDIVGGDVPPIARIKLTGESGNPTGTADMRANRVVMGLRSYDRGDDFAAYLNFANEQNPTGLTVTAPDANSNLEVDVTTPTGVRIRWQSPGASGTDEIARLAFNSALIPDFYGQYHVFLRGRRASGVAADIDVYLQYSIVTPIGTNVALTQSEVVQFQGTALWEVLDFGKLQIPGATLPMSEGVYEYWIQVIGENTTAATAIDVVLFDLILIPVDEWAADYKDSWTSGATGYVEYGYYLDADGIAYPKRPKRAIVKTDADLVCDIWVAITPQPPMLQANERQRLWFFSGVKGANYTVAEPYHGHTIQMWKNQLYLSMRGDR